MSDLAEQIRCVLKEKRGVTEKKMFGGICFLHRGNMLCGVTSKDELMVRVGPKQYEKALRLPHAREMDFTGRPMRGMIHIEPAGYAKKGDLVSWIEMGLAFTRSLPKK